MSARAVNNFEPESGSFFPQAGFDAPSTADIFLTSLLLHVSRSYEVHFILFQLLITIYTNGLSRLVVSNLSLL